MAGIAVPNLFYTRMRTYVRRTDVKAGKLKPGTGVQILKRQNGGDFISVFLSGGPLSGVPDLVRKGDPAAEKASILYQRGIADDLPQVSLQEIYENAGFELPAEIALPEDRDARLKLAEILGVFGFPDEEARIIARLPVDAQRAYMVEKHLKGGGISDPRVLAAMGRVPREEFIPEDQRPFAYGNFPVGIGGGQTISQPWVVASMTQALELTGNEKVLEVGTGSGYQAAILAGLCREVFTIERKAPLASQAREVLAGLGIANVTVVKGDGTKGLPCHAPFDRIIVTAGSESPPQALLDQLAEGGKLIIPLGPHKDEVMTVITREGGKFERRQLFSCAFVPLVDEANPFEALRRMAIGDQIKFFWNNPELAVGAGILKTPALSFLWPAFINFLEQSCRNSEKASARVMRARLDAIFQQFNWDYGFLSPEKVRTEIADPEWRKQADKISAYLLEKGCPSSWATKIILLVKRFPLLFFMPRFYSYAPRSVYFEPVPLHIGDPNAPALFPAQEILLLAALDVREGQKVMEVKTGRAWATAILSQLVGGKGAVDSYEASRLLHEQARRKLDFFGINNVNLFLGENYEDSVAARPEGYDAISVPLVLPDVMILEALMPQLKDGGRIAAFIGEPESGVQLAVVTKRGNEASVAYLQTNL